MLIQRTSRRPPGLPVWDPYWRSVRRLSQVRGMPVIDLTRAHRVGQITEIFVDSEAQRVAALQIGPFGEFRQKFVAGAHIRRIGTHAVVVQADPADDAIRSLDASDDVIDSRTLGSLEVLADNGDRVGYVSDIYVNPDSLIVRSYELRTPLFERWLRGRRVIAPHQVQLCSRELMLVPASVLRPTRPGDDEDKFTREETLRIVPDGRNHRSEVSAKRAA